MVHRAVAKGLLTPMPCNRCGTNIHVHAHHENYSKPLEVIWLCAAHHRERHKELKPCPTTNYSPSSSLPPPA
jgi:uncharacterized membrane protein (UPF0127 family)